MNHGEGQFAVTRWTLVLRARDGDSVGQRALSELCEAYYEPVVAFLRYRCGKEDLAREQAHAFFARVLGGGGLTGVDPSRGRFRNYLLGALRHFLADAHDRACAERRGAGKELASINDTEAGQVIGDRDDNSVFDRQWALTVVERALGAVAEEARRAGKHQQFESLKPWLSGSGEALPIADAAARLGQSEGAAKVAIHRLRARFRELVKGEIAQTVPAKSDVEDELRYLVTVLTRTNS